MTVFQYKARLTELQRALDQKEITQREYAEKRRQLDREMDT